MIPRGLVGPVLAMARPARPAVERDAVRAAAARMNGSAAARARRLAAAVVAAAMSDMDAEPIDRIIVLLRTAAGTPTTVLATDPAIDTAALIRAERRMRMEKRGFRHLPEREWACEDREISRAVIAVLAKRYARHLAK